MSGGSTRSAAEWTLSRILTLGLICVFWAGSSVAAKIALGDGGATGQGKIGPFTLASLRFGAAGLLLVLLLRTRHELVPIARDDLLRFVLLGALGIAITYAVMYGGLLYTTATETTLLFGAEPVLIALLARLVLGEHLRSAQSVGMMLGLIGVYLVVFRGLAPRFEGTIVANAIVSGSMLFEAYASVLGKRLAGRYPGLMVASVEMLVGSALLLPFAIRELATQGGFRLGLSEWAAVGYLTLICSALCYGVWYALLSRHTVSSMAAFLFIQPLMGPVLSYVLLKETLGGWSILGGLLVILGVALVVRTPATTAEAA